MIVWHIINFSVNYQANIAAFNGHVSVFKGNYFHCKCIYMPLIISLVMIMQHAHPQYKYLLPSFIHFYNMRAESHFSRHVRPNYLKTNLSLKLLFYLWLTRQTMRKKTRLVFGLGQTLNEGMRGADGALFFIMCLLCLLRLLRCLQWSEHILLSTRRMSGWTETMQSGFDKCWRYPARWEQLGSLLPLKR